MKEPAGPSRPSGVLVVDDEAPIRNLLSLSLPRFGFKVWVAADGPAAVALYQRHAGEIDLALLDLHMPGMDGAATALALRRLGAELPCCLLSGDGDSDTAAACGCAHLIGKPFTAAEVAAWCASAIQAVRNEAPVA